MSNNPDDWLIVLAPEEGVFAIDVYARDSAGDLTTPTSVTWTLTDLAGTVINSRTNVSATPGNPTRITLSGDDLALTDQTKAYEIRALLVKTLVGGVYNTKQKRFKVQNFIAVT